MRDDVPDELIRAIEDIDWNQAYSHALGLAIVFDDVNAVSQLALQEALDAFDPAQDQVLDISLHRLVAHIASLRAIGADLFDFQRFLANADLEPDDDEIELAPVDAGC
jgi:hypothetical protein